MKIAVLFDGGGLARLGLEQAGHDCMGFELDRNKHELSKHVGSGDCVLADVRDVSLSQFDAVWASPPCQFHSVARNSFSAPTSEFSTDLLQWSHTISADILWVENVISASTKVLGTPYNAAQFLEVPIQCRNRIIGGRYLKPKVFREYAHAYGYICPCITASEFAGCASDQRRASRFYGRKLSLQECAYHQGFEIPEAWDIIPPWWQGTKVAWRNNQYQAIGNGVPCYMAKAFGDVYSVAG